MSLFQRIPDPANQAREYSPLFHFLEDYSYHTRKAQYALRKAMPAGLNAAWSPSFAVRETSQAYEVHADLPGISNETLNIEFTGENTLSISGQKERGSMSSSDSDSDGPATPTDEGQDVWSNMVNSIDAATCGPKPGARRTSIVDASTWTPPTENIDQATFLHPDESKRRPSLRNARTWQQPAESIDAYSHHVPAHKRQPRRPSVVDAMNWQQPPESIDGATTGPIYDPAATLLSAAVRPFALPHTLPENELDASVTGARRSATTVAGPWRRLRINSTPALPEERLPADFEHEIKFPGPVNREGVTATLKEGSLKIVVPKRQSGERMKVPVSVS